MMQSASENTPQTERWGKYPNGQQMDLCVLNYIRDQTEREEVDYSVANAGEPQMF